MDFAYHWVDRSTGKRHYTFDRDEADRALHDGNFIELVMLDKKHRNGSDRMAS